MTMAATERHHGRVIPLCATCRDEADCVVAYTNGEAMPYCFMCANVQIAVDSREYPLEEFYTHDNGRVVEFDPPDETFDLYDPADETQRSWISADNSGRAESSIDLEEMI